MNSQPQSMIQTIDGYLIIAFNTDAYIVFNVNNNTTNLHSVSFIRQNHSNHRTTINVSLGLIPLQDYPD